MHNYLKGIALLLTLLFSLSCRLFSLPATPVVVSTPTGAVALQSPVLTATSAPLMPTETSAPLTPTDTSAPLMPTDTSAPLAPTRTPAPASLNATGPHILFKGQSSGIWMTNPDGSFPTRISEYMGQNDVSDLRRAISPAGDRMALVAQNDQGLDLVLVKIPGGEMETIAHLISITNTEDLTNPKTFAALAIRDYDSVSWQPGGGRLLAFIGAINGPTADLYTYDTQTKKITQLTSGPSQAVLPSWSPDGQYILNFGVSWVPPFGGGWGPANMFDGVWAVHVSDGKVITLPRPKFSNLPNFVGWQDDSHYITYDNTNECSSQNLRSVNVASGETKPIMDYSFHTYIARSPENGAFLFSGGTGCPNSLGEGTFLLLPGQTTPVKLLDKQTWYTEWLPESKLFYAHPEALISSDGNTRYDPPVYDDSYDPAVSMRGYQAWVVYINTVAHINVMIPGGDWQDVFSGNVSLLIWDPIDGKTLLIASENGSLYAASYPDFTPRLMGSLGGRMDQVIWLP